MISFFKILQSFHYLNIKTILFNLNYFPFFIAIKLPVYVSKQTLFLKKKGRIKIEGSIKTGMIKIGYGTVGIFDKKYSRTIWEVEGEIVFNGKASIGYGSKISVAENAILSFGDNFMITANSSIVVAKKIQFGNDCLLSWDILIMDTDYHQIIDNNGNVINTNQPVIIGEHVWIACRTTILKGAIIPNNSIIAANSVLTKKLEEENSIWGGNPVFKIKEDISWES